MSFRRDPAEVAADAQACDLLNKNTEPPVGVYCEGTFDQWLCWPHTRANTTVFQHCPAFVPGFSPFRMAHKECTLAGTWWRHPASGKLWSNYTGCVAPEDDLRGVVLAYELGYGLSLVALVAALLLLWRLRALRCARITLHCNLFAAFALNNLLWLGWYALVVRSPPTVGSSPAWCRLLAALTQYALLATYSWMLCEGVYLHTVLVHAFVSERRLVRALLLAGWLLPLPSVLVFAGRRLARGDALCWMDEGAARPELVALAGTALLLNALFLCNIVRVLCVKLQQQQRPGAAPAGPCSAARRARDTALHALRATCLLAPLLGLQFLLTPFRPARDSPYWLPYEYLAATTSSLQGLCVAVLYCFLNGEVLAQLRRRWHVMLFRPRANSTTNTNTTVSFVRSANAANAVNAANATIAVKAANSVNAATDAGAGKDAEEVAL